MKTVQGKCVIGNRQPGANKLVLMNLQLAIRYQFDFRLLKTIKADHETGKQQADANY